MAQLKQVAPEEQKSGKLESIVFKFDITHFNIGFIKTVLCVSARPLKIDFLDITCRGYFILSSGTLPMPNF